MKSKIINTVGKRKTAIARVTLIPGTGKIRFNNKSADLLKGIYALRLKEPLLLSDVAEKVNLIINVKGGGISSQVDAARIAIANALVQYKPSLKELFLDYDRSMLVADVRFKEVSKPNSHGQARAKRQKSYR